MECSFSKDEVLVCLEMSLKTDLTTIRPKQTLKTRITILLVTFIVELEQLKTKGYHIAGSNLKLEWSVLRIVCQCGKCVSTSAAGAKPKDLLGITFGTHRFWGFSTMYMHPKILRPRALFYRTDCTPSFKFITHALQ